MFSEANSPDALTIRPIRNDEIAQVVVVLREAAEWLTARGIPQWQPADFDASVVARWMSGGVVLAAWRNTHAIGTITLDEQDDGLWTQMPDKAGYIHKLAISRAVAGQGVSLALLRAAEARIAAQGFTFVRLDCWAGNDALRKFYTQAGYTLRAIVTETADGETWDCALFEQALR